MALRFIDGFDHYNIAHLSEKWTNSLTVNGSVLQTSPNRHGWGQSLMIHGNNGGDWILKTIDGQSTWTIGFAAYFVGLYTFSDPYGIFLSLYNAGSHGIMCLEIQSNTGMLYVGYNGGAGTPANQNEVSTGYIVRLNNWVYIECQVVTSTTAGQITVRANGSQVYQSPANLNLGYANADTWAVGNFTLGIPSARRINTNLNVDDLYICDQQPGASGFLGDISVVPLLPNGAGSSTQFAIGGSAPAATNWQSVDETPPDDDVTYVFSSTAGQEDLYTVQTQLPTPAAPTLSSASTGGTITAGTYQVEVTYVNADGGETTASTSASMTTTGSTSTITIDSPAAAGSGGAGLAASGWYAYVTQAGGSTFTRQQAAGSPTAIGTNLALTAPPTSTGAKPPIANTTGLPGTGSVLGVQANVFARKDDAGTRTIAPLVHTGANTAAGAGQNIGGSYADYLQMWETNPANGNAAWSLSEFATDQFGVEEVA